MNSCLILDGKKVAEENSENLIARVKKLNDFGRPPKLVAILVGDDPASATYVTMKERACHSLGIETEILRLAKRTNTHELQQIIKDLNNDQTVDGILLQHPVPEQIDEIQCFNTICLEKDVDGVTTEGFGNMAMGLNAFGSCTPLGIMRILGHYKINLVGKKALVIGRSQILGKPMAAMLLNAHATVTIAHSKTKDLKNSLKEYDLVVVAVGVPRFVSANDLKVGSVLIDAGYHPAEKCGDVDMTNISNIVSAYTPVPGGVGPMTINTLMMNTVEAMERKYE
ncbi:MAG: bifunctional 5,10-methylene-tetrahydrofolate dehydrogenase/5,10-methylene-tetrahydrofolate cyclohydrolase [Gammaproteobacteria bacterium TMED219]|nr:MAG: bifunctional 5,10-methylene-tetrahydrofolate dehydrogenase/5,10-methylene-tetrahydrofolate cyclohydrolase [Gammaproteobacteria bacterium TMED219]